MKWCLVLIIQLFVVTAISAGFVEAEGRSEPEILLTVQRLATGGSVKQFDIDGLDALPQISFRTSTIWTEGVIEFSGPSLLSVLAKVGEISGTVTAFALNDYNMMIHTDGLSDEYPIIATRMNGELFSVRERGPLWLVYPYDSNPAFRDERIYAQSVWQLFKLTLD